MNRDLPYVSFSAFLDHWQGVRMVTLELLATFSEDDLGYRLVPEWRTAGEIFYHIGAHQYFVARGVLLRRWRPATGEPDADWTLHQADRVTSVARLRQWLEETQAQVNRWTEGQADDAVLRDLRPDNPWHEGIRGWLLLHHAYQDELHHRGQLYAIARLIGKLPPVAFAEEYPAYWAPRKSR